jgi:hypothetical protein
VKYPEYLQNKISFFIGEPAKIKKRETPAGVLFHIRRLASPSSTIKIVAKQRPKNKLLLETRSLQRLIGRFLRAVEKSATARFCDEPPG